MVLIKLLDKLILYRVKNNPILAKRILNALYGKRDDQKIKSYVDTDILTCEELMKGIYKNEKTKNV